MLHIWHLFTTASCLFLCLTCPYLVTECKNHHDEQLNVEQAEVQTNYDKLRQITTIHNTKNFP